MALESDVNFKAAIALAAVQLNAAMQDTVESEMANDIRNPNHPLRQLKKLFSLDGNTGVWTSNDSYIDQSYAGAFPAVGNGQDKLTDLVPITLVSATVEDAAPADMVLTFSRAITGVNDLEPNLGKIVQTIAGIGTAVITLTMTGAYVNGNTITISGLFRYSAVKLQLSDESVTNNVL